MKLTDEQKERVLGAVEALVELRDEASQEFRVQYGQPEMDLSQYHQLIDKYCAKRNEFIDFVSSIRFYQS